MGELFMMSQLNLNNELDISEYVEFLKEEDQQESTNIVTETEQGDMEDEDPEEYGEQVSVREDTKDQDPDKYGELVGLKDDFKDEDTDE